MSVACRSTSRLFSAEIARVGVERTVVWSRAGLAGGWRDAPAGASASGCDWPESFSYAIPAEAPSGYYEVVLRCADERSGRLVEGLAFFVVRPGSPSGREALRSDRRRFLLVLATNTYNAYNDWGGPNLYTGATRVSFRRPMAAGFLSKPEPHHRYPTVTSIDDPEHESFRTWADLNGLARWSGSAGWHNWERVFVRFAEKEGYEVGVAAGSDLELHPEVLDDMPLVVSVGHDEYWSWKMRDTLETFVAGGGNVAFFSGNAVFWQVRLEDGGSTMVCHKGSTDVDPVVGTDAAHLLTTYWSASAVGRPENRLTGVSFSRGGYVRMGRAVPRASGGYTAWRPEHWVFHRTGLRYGDVFGTEDSIVAYEVDGCEMTLSLDDGLPVPTGRDGTPDSFVILATAPARLWSKEELPSRYRPDDYGDLEALAEAIFGSASPAHVARLAHNHAVMGTYAAGGTVFTAGTTDWAYGLAGNDPTVTRITRNVLERLTSSP